MVRGYRHSEKAFSPIDPVTHEVHQTNTMPNRPVKQNGFNIFCIHLLFQNLKLTAVGPAEANAHNDTRSAPHVVTTAPCRKLPI